MRKFWDKYRSSPYYKEEMIGCKEYELNEIKSLVRKSLPLIYTDLLTKIGKKGGRFLQGSDFFYPNILNLNSWARELLEENNFRDLPDNSFVFLMHQGYQFWFFVCEDEEDDPVVMYYQEAQNEDFFIPRMTLSQFFITLLESELKVIS